LQRRKRLTKRKLDEKRRRTKNIKHGGKGE
jgi:hypothetical protein